MNQTNDGTIFEEPMDKIHIPQGFSMLFIGGEVPPIKDEVVYLELFSFNKKINKIARQKDKKRNTILNQEVVLTMEAIMVDKRHVELIAMDTTNVTFVEANVSRV